MALVRCEKHPVDLKKAKSSYERRVKPFGYPTTAAICGHAGCKNPGYVWLTDKESVQFRLGQRYFNVHTAAVTIRTENMLLPLP
jgi:hypothetical protein